MAHASLSPLHPAPFVARGPASPPLRLQLARRHLRLVSDGPCAPAPIVANPRLGAAICIGFCGLFWSAVVLAVVWS